MLLFQITKSLFDAWMKQIISTGLMYIMLAVSIGLMVKLIFGQIEQLLFFRVCWQTVWEFKILGITIIDLKFWYPQSAPEFLNAVNAINFFSFLLLSIIFFSLMDKIPEMVDSLMGAGRMPNASMYRSGMGQFNSSFVGTSINKVKSTMKQGAMAAITYVDRGATAKITSTVNKYGYKIKKLKNKLRGSKD